MMNDVCIMIMCHKFPGRKERMGLEFHRAYNQELNNEEINLFNSRYFSWTIQKKWDDRRVHVAINYEPHLVQSTSEVSAIPRQPSNSLFACPRQVIQTKLKPRH